MTETKKKLYAETSEFDGTMFGEAYHVEELADESLFEDYCEKIMFSHWLACDSDCEIELEDEQARPNSDIITARQFTIPENDECSTKMYSMFLREY